MYQDPSYRNYGDSCSGVYPPEDFEGVWTERWRNGQIKFRGQYSAGLKRIGLHVSFYENGVLQEVSYWNDGWACGTTLWFRDDGSKEYEKDYGEHGGMTRCWTEKYFSISGALGAVRVYRDDKLFAEWLNQETRNVLDQINADQVIQDAVNKLYPDEDS